MSTMSEQSVPAPLSSVRDEVGRLVGLRFGSSEPMPGDGWLLAVDGSEHALHAVSEAIRLMNDMKQGCLHLLNVQHWLSKEAADAELGSRGWAETAGARALLAASPHAWRLHVAMGEPASCIVAQAHLLACRGIVIGSRGLGAGESLLLGSVVNKVLHTGTLPVLVVR